MADLQNISRPPLLQIMQSCFVFSPPSPPSHSLQVRIPSLTVCRPLAPQPRRASCHIFAKTASPSSGAISTTSRQYEGISWSKVELMCAQLVEQARSQRFDVVLAVTRGGLIPAVLLCEAFQIRNVLSATVMFYSDNGEQFFGMTEPRFLCFPSADALEGRRVLVVDDVWDSGRTAQAVSKRVQRARPKDVKVAVLHFKPEMNQFPGTKPDYYSATTRNWVVYPWERASPQTPHISCEEEKCEVFEDVVDSTN